jgi:hypothetical protein
MYDIQYRLCMSYNWFGTLYHQIAYKISICGHFVKVKGWATFAYSWIKSLIIVDGYWYSGNCHKHIICDNLVKMLIYLNVVKMAGIWNPWMEEEKAMGHLLSKSL